MLVLIQHHWVTLTVVDSMGWLGLMMLVAYTAHGSADYLAWQPQMLTVGLLFSNCGFNEAVKHRVSGGWPAFKLGVKLASKKEWMINAFNNLD